MHHRTRKVHRPDGAEDQNERALWRAPCGWPYGQRNFYRLSEAPQGADLCNRVQGPCKAPPGCVPAANFQRCDRLVDPPPGDIFVAASFAIVQEDETGGVKIRRGRTGADRTTTPLCRRPTSPLTTWWATMWTWRPGWPNRARRFNA